MFGVSDHAFPVSRSDDITRGERDLDLKFGQNLNSFPS